MLLLQKPKKSSIKSKNQLLELQLRPEMDTRHRQGPERAMGVQKEAKEGATRCGDRTHDHTVKSRALFRTELTGFVPRKRILEYIIL